MTNTPTYIIRYAHRYTCTHTFVHTHTHAHTHTQVHMHTHTHTHTHTHIHTHTNKYNYAYVYDILYIMITGAGCILCCSGEWISGSVCQYFARYLAKKHSSSEKVLHMLSLYQSHHAVLPNGVHTSKDSCFSTNLSVCR